MRTVILIVHDIRSIYNVGSLLRTAECLGVHKIFFTGFTPYPKHKDDYRLPHLQKRINNQIHKTALGAENNIAWEHQQDIYGLIHTLKADGYKIIGLEQAETSISLSKLKPTEKVALIIGREVEGVDLNVLELCDQIVEIPMYGKKESLNVVQATAIALYVLRES